MNYISEDLARAIIAERLAAARRQHQVAEARRVRRLNDTGHRTRAGIRWPLNLLHARRATPDVTPAKPRPLLVHGRLEPDPADRSVTGDAPRAALVVVGTRKLWAATKTALSLPS